MGRARTIARRTFLIGSAAVAGGVAFGLYRYLRDEPNPLEGEITEGAVTFNPFVIIAPDGITAITPRADVGQGIASMQAYLLAEELDVDPLTLRQDPGPVASAYFNEVVATEAFPILNYGTSLATRAADATAAIAGKVLGLHLTGGSTSVPDMHERMREAGASARETLVAAAMAQTGLDRDQLRTENGAVVLPDRARLAYTDLAAAAADIEPIRDVPLRPPAKWRYLGKPHLRTDIVAKSTGLQTYGIDIRQEGMVHATTRTNPARGGGLLDYDAAEAEKMRGVIKVLPITDGIAVVGDNTWRVMQAAAAVDCTFGPSPYPGDTAELFEHVAAAFSEDRREWRLRNDGDAEAALGAGEAITAEYRLPYLAHAPLEPMNATVRFDAGRLDIWSGTQVPGFMRMAAARLAGISTSDVHIHVEMSGGSFGRRLEDDYVRQAVEIALQMPGTPVKMTWSREEDFTRDFPRPLAIARARGAVSSAGVETFDLSISTPSVLDSMASRISLPVPLPAELPIPDQMMIAGATDQPFAIPNYRVSAYRVPAMVPVSSWRSVGASGNGFLHETFLDELCHAAGVDPLAERLRLCTHMPSQKVLEAVRDMSGWGSEMAQGRGRGLAFSLSFGVPVAQVVEVTQTDGGIRIDRVYVAADAGQILDPVNFEAQLSGGVIWGLGHAMNCELTYQNGVPEQDNYHLYEAMRLYQTPQIEVRGLENGDRIRGIGEPGVPPAAPALGNAIFAATGQRIRELPFSKHVDFL